MAHVLRRARLRRPEGRPALATNNQRVCSARDAAADTARERLASAQRAELARRFEKAGLPFAPIRKPEDLFDDPHLLATGGLADVRCPTGRRPGRR